MAKVRIHEIAKELNVPARDVIGYLNSNKIEAKSHMSTLDTQTESMVRGKFGQSKEEPKKKKANISAVFHPQNSKNPDQRNKRRKTQNSRTISPVKEVEKTIKTTNQSQEKKNEAVNPVVKEAANQTVTAAMPAMKKSTDVKESIKTSEHKEVAKEATKTTSSTVANEPVKATTASKEPSNTTTASKEPIKATAERPTSSNAGRPTGNNVRPQGNNTYRTTNRNNSSDRNRNAGDRPHYNNNTGDRPRYNNNNTGTNTNTGDRPRYNNNNTGSSTNTGDRPRYNNNTGDRPRYNNNNTGTNTNTGDRPRYNNNTGDRPRYNNNNTGTSTNAGDRPRYNNNTGDRPRYNNNTGTNTNTGDRPRYNNNTGTNTGDRPHYNNNTGDRPRYNNTNSGGARTGGYNNNNGGGARTGGYNNNNSGGARTGGYNNNNSGGARTGGYNNNNSGGARTGGYNNNNSGGARTGGYNNNNSGGSYGNRTGGYNNNNSGGSYGNRDGGRDGGRDSRGAVDAKKKEGTTIPKPKENRRFKTKPVHVNYNKATSKRQERTVNLEKRTRRKPQKTPRTQEEKNEIKMIKLPMIITVRELADKMKMVPSDIVKKLFLAGKVVTVNQDLDFEAAEEVALEYNFIAEKESKVDVIAELLAEQEEDETTMVPRPPVVCVMGHVDHGKTSLLDAIRDTHVIDREAGGITQHIGAYVVTKKGQKITFLDTPGHEAFTAMRMRGAKSTDIAILVVAADDGVMPQTIEAINHAKAANIEIIVAINKIDKPGANIERVKQELSEYELIPEDWGGSTIFAPVSAHTGEGIDQLLEMVLLAAEVSELKANPNRLARGLVLEAKLDKGRGVVATVLVQKGTLEVGQPISAGSSYGKVRAMINDCGHRVKTAGPSMPVEILGLNDVPNAGDVFIATENEKDSRSFSETFISEGREKMLDDTKSKMSLDDLFTQIQAGNLKELGVIVKADVQGSVEAVRQSLVKLSNDEVVVKVIHGGVGAITESDVNLASASNAIIIGFNVRPDATAKSIAEQQHVDMRLYSVIYNAIEDVEAAMKGMLDPIYEEKVIGHAEIRQIFNSSGIGNIGGSYILDGIFKRGCSVRVTREGKQVFEGKLASIKRFKDDVKEVKTGYECGLVFEEFNAIKAEDLVEAYEMVEVPR